MYVEAFHQKLQEITNFLINQGLLDDNVLKYYSKFNTHSIFQYALIKAGIDLGYFSIPEFKVRFNEPINKLEVDERFKQVIQGKKAKNMRHRRVDVAYFKDKQFFGIGEIYTPDEIHEIQSPKEFPSPHITVRYRIEHTIKETNPKFIIVINIISTLPQWKESKKYTLIEWENKWKEFIKKIHYEYNTECLHIIIRNIREIEFNPIVR
jgi:hypothetical protein